MTRSHMAIIGLAFLMLAPDLNGQIPKKITYQGVVRDVNGDLYPDGPINLLFRIYDATTAGNLHHEEFHSTTNVTIPDTVKNGTFTAVLGPQAVGVYANLDLLSPSIPLWLEIAIWDGFEWDIQLPRTAFTTVLYAASAAEVARADTAGIIIGDNIFPSSGNVGIGTNTPTAALQVVGLAKLDSIEINTTTRWYSIGHSEFSGFGGTLALDTLGAYIYSASSSFLVTAGAGVHLPHGATILELVLLFLDDGPPTTPDSTTFEFKLSALNPGFAANVIAEYTSSGQDAVIQEQVIAGIGHVVDNQNNAYVVTATWRAPTYPEAEKMKLYGARIKYSISTPLP